MLLIKNGYVRTMAGDPIDGGSVLIGDDGKIIEVGKNIKAPKGAEVIDAEGRLVTPGCVEAHCHLGLRRTAIGWEGAEQNEKSDPITPHMRAIDAIYTDDESFDNALGAGVTTVCTGPGSVNVVGGTFAAIKTAGRLVDDMVIKYPVAMKCAFGENAKNFYGQSGKKAPITRMAVAALLRELLFKAKRYLEDKKTGKNPAFDMKLEAMIPVMEGEIPLKAHAHTSNDIFTAIRIAKEFGVKLTLDHCTDGALFAEELAKEGYPIISGPLFGAKSKVELQNKGFKNPGILVKAGNHVSITTDAPVTPIQHLPMCAGLAHDAGLAEDDAWRAITINPAETIGIADRVGSLEVGKDGDVVIWTANPMTVLGAAAYITVVDGKIVHRIEE